MITNNEFLDSFAAQFLKNTVDIDMDLQFLEDSSLYENIKKDIFLFLLPDNKNFSELISLKDICNNVLKNEKEIEIFSTKLKNKYHILTNLQSAQKSLDEIICNEPETKFTEFNNQQLKADSVINMNYKLHPLLKSSFNIESPFENPENKLTIALAKKYLNTNEYNILKEKLQIKETDNEIDSLIENFEILMEKFKSSEIKPDLLLDKDYIKEVDENLESRLESLIKKLKNNEEQTHTIDKDLTSSLFNCLMNNKSRFKTSNLFLYERAKDVGIILSRLQFPKLKDSQLSDKLDSWFPEKANFQKERLFNTLNQINLAQASFKGRDISKRDILPFKQSYQLLIQEDSFLQDLAKRKLINEVSADYSIPESENNIPVSIEKKIPADLQYLMEVTSKFGKQIYKTNMLVENLQNSQENISPQTIINNNSTQSNNTQIEELARLIKTFKTDIEKNILKQSQKEVTLKLLGVIDFFDNLLKNIQDTDSNEMNSIRESIEIIYRKFMRILKDFGLTQIESINKKFDPEYHECVDLQSNTGYDPNTIIEEVLKSLFLNLVS